MNISQEKEHLYSLMRELTQERRRITDMYFELKERLDKLHKLEERGLDQLDVKGYIDMYKQFDQDTKTSNIQREANNAINNVHQTNFNSEQTHTAKEIDKEIKSQNHSKKRNRINYEKVTSLIVNILKESGRPMKVKEIYDEVIERNEYYIAYPNFRNNVMKRTMETHSKINRITKGYYQYKN